MSVVWVAVERPRVIVPVCDVPPRFNMPPTALVPRLVVVEEAPFRLSVELAVSVDENDCVDVKVLAKLVKATL
jgi:hypothetical protein